MKSVLDQGNYNFADYFKFGYETEELTAYFGYGFSREMCTLPRSNMELNRLPDLLLRLQENTRHTSLNSEIARREFLIAPVLTELIIYTHSKVRVEYPLNVNDQLKGSLDYLVQGKHELLVIEAKNADLEQGFKQLTAELIALDKWLENASPSVFGAVSIGNIWQFGILRRAEKQIIQDINLFRVPADVEDLLRIMIGIVD